MHGDEADLARTRLAKSGTRSPGLRTLDQRAEGGVRRHQPVALGGSQVRAVLSRRAETACVQRGETRQSGGSGSAPSVSETAAGRKCPGYHAQRIYARLRIGPFAR